MSLAEEELALCLSEEGKARGICVNQAKAMGFCSGCKTVCNNNSKRVVLSWFHGSVRLNWKWRDFDVLAYSREQAIKLLRDMVGYHIRLGSSDCKLRFVRFLSMKETMKHGCKIKYSEG